jgi:hypothetical protein
LLSIFPIYLFADLSTIDELESFPNKQAVDVLLVKDEVVLPDNGGIFQSFQELFEGKPVVALIKK